MLTRLRSTWLAGSGAVLLAIAVSGAVAASSIRTAISAPATDLIPVAEVVLDTTKTFEDVDGDGVDDDCDDAAVADEAAAAAAKLAADLDGDGTISVSEAAHTDWVGGTNCNHGGYVSAVAHADGTCVEAEETPATAETVSVVMTAQADEAVCEAPVVEPVVEEEAPTECTATTPVAEPVVETPPADLAKNAHGKAVSEVAHDKAAVGGKNCNHGGAVSEAAKKDHAAEKTARDAKKAEQTAARDARKDAQKSQQKSQKSQKSQHAAKIKGG